MLHLLLQISPKLRLVITNEWQRCVIGSTKISCFMECHWCSNVHVARVKHQIPPGWAFSTVKNCLIVHVQRKVLNLKELWVIGKITNTRRNCECFVPVPEVVSGVDFGFINIASAVMNIRVCY